MSKRHPLYVLLLVAALAGAGRAGDSVRYVAWIKPYGQGRVFYCSPLTDAVRSETVCHCFCEEVAQGGEKSGLAQLVSQ